MAARSASPREPGDATLRFMPDEVLLKIWSLLDNPQNFSLVCQEFREFTQMAEVRALYFRMRYGRELAMFHAIARPKVFNKAVCKLLVDIGGVISLALMQELSKRWFASGPARTDLNSKDKWGLNLSFSSVLAVLSEGAKRFPRLNAAKTSEMELFSDWLNGRNSITREGLMTMFLKRDFSPLPLRDIVFGGYGSPLITVERITAVADCIVAQRDARTLKRKRLQSVSSAQDEKKHGISGAKKRHNLETTGSALDEKNGIKTDPDD